MSLIVYILSFAIKQINDDDDDDDDEKFPRSSRRLLVAVSL